VHEDHVVRKLKATVDLSYIYKEIEHLYADYGMISIDPVILIKLNIILYVFGIRSMRQTLKVAEVNAAYRWYLGYGMLEKLPHFSTFSKNYARKFGRTDLFEKIFKQVLGSIAKAGYLDAKKPLKDDRKAESREIKVSKTDPDCGVFHKGEHKVEFAYCASVVCDGHNYILDMEVRTWNVNDSSSFPQVYERMSKSYPQMENVVMDAGYKTPAIVKQVIDSGRRSVLPYKRPMTKDGFFKKYEYVYDEHYDCYICPANKTLEYSTTNRNGYREYKSCGIVRAKRPQLARCTLSRDHVKTVARHAWEVYMEQAKEIRHTIGYKEIYGKRKETIERVFADGKEKHGLGYLKHRGIARVKMELTLLFASMNLKKFAMRVWNPDTLIAFIRKVPVAFIAPRHSGFAA
jgi:transposase